MQTPSAPLNARVLLADGTERPVQPVYEGRHHGIDDWVVIWTEPEEVGELRCDRLPARSSLGLRVEQ